MRRDLACLRVLAEINLGREIVRCWHVEDEDATVSRSPTSEEEQLQQATHILRLRLVEPARKLADAEMIAGHLSHREAVRIRFVDPEDRPGKGGARLPPGDASPGDRLCFWRDRPTAMQTWRAGPDFPPLTTRSGIRPVLQCLTARDAAPCCSGRALPKGCRGSSDGRTGETSRTYFQARAFRHSSHDVRQYPELREAPYRVGGNPDMPNLRSR